MAQVVVLRPIPSRAVVAILTLGLAVGTACDGTNVVPIEVATVVVSPPEATMLAGAEMSFQAEPRGPDGDVLSGRFVSWTSEDATVATVSGSGEVAALVPGTTRVTATIEGVSASSDLTVLPGPEIQLAPAGLDFSGVEGDGALDPQTIDISNATPNGQVSGLEMFINYDAGGATGWLAGSGLSGSVAPATITVRPNIFGISQGSYSASIEVRSNTAVNSPQIAVVTLSVGEARPAIGLSQSTASVSVPRFFPNAVPFASISVTNTGGGQLTGLNRVIQYQGVPGWLTATLDGTQAPTTLRLTAQAGALPPGQYNATVMVRSNDATNSPQQVAVTLTITP